MSEVEENFPKSRIHSFLKGITKLCKKHKVSIYTDEIRKVCTTMLDFSGWEEFSELEADPTSSSVYWPRIETHIMHEEGKVAEREAFWGKDLKTSDILYLTLPEEETDG